MKFTILKVKGSSMHPIIESGAFVLVWRSKWLFNQNKLLPRLSITQLSFTQFVGELIPLPSCFKTAGIQLKVGDVVAVNHKQYGLIVKRVVKISSRLQSTAVSDRNEEANKNQYKASRLKSVNKKQLVQFRLRGDNTAQSVTESDMGWVDADALIGKVLFIINNNHRNNNKHNNSHINNNHQ